MTGLAKLATNIEKAIPKIITESNKASQKTAREVLTAAFYFSSGTYSLADLRAMGHPYGIGVYSGGRRWRPGMFRGSIPYGTPEIINAQSGTFRDDWRMYVKAGYTGAASGLYTYAICNIDPVAKFLQFGTSKMIARPIDKLLKPIAQAVQARNLQAAISPILRKAFTA